MGHGIINISNLSQCSNVVRGGSRENRLGGHTTANCAPLRVKKPPSGSPKT